MAHRNPTRFRLGQPIYHPVYGKGHIIESDIFNRGSLMVGFPGRNVVVKRKDLRKYTRKVSKIS